MPGGKREDCSIEVWNLLSLSTIYMSGPVIRQRGKNPNTRLA